VYFVAADKKDQGGDAEDLELRSQPGLGIDVDPGQGDFGMLPGKLVQDRGQQPAGLAPGGLEIDQHRLGVHAQRRIEAFRSQRPDRDGGGVREGLTAFAAQGGAAHGAANAVLDPTGGADDDLSHAVPPPQY